MSDNRPTALVTGASAGLGEEYCRQLAERCDTIIAVARREDRLRALQAELAGTTRLVPVVADLATVEGVTRTVEALRQQGPADILINNAGFSTFGDFGRSVLEDELRVVRLQIDATLELVRAAVPFMRERGGGEIINVASVGAFLNMKQTAVYGGCKAFLVSFSRALQAELASDNIRVQCLCPGLTRTEIHDTAYFEGFDKARMPAELWMDAAPVVAASLAALGQGEVVVLPGSVNGQLAREGLQQLLQSLQ